MSIYLQNIYDSEHMNEEYLLENKLENYSNTVESENTNLESNIVFNNLEVCKTSHSTEDSNVEYLGEPSSIKSSVYKEHHETSPFRQAVKGFVINKLSKKIASSHLLHGITEKIVRKLEESNTEIPVTCKELEKSHSVPQLKDLSSHIACNVSPCELKSVVANDLHDFSSVEEAIECFEEIRSTSNYESSNSKENDNPKISRSLPSSPSIHSRAVISNDLDYSSDSEVKNFTTQSFTDSTLKKSHHSNLPVNVPSINLEEKLCSSKNASKENTNITNNLPFELTSNEKELFRRTPSKANIFRKIIHMLQMLFVSMPSSYLILLSSVLIHNFSFFSYYNMSLIFDSFIIAYICYVLICIFLENQTESLNEYPGYDGTCLENASIHHNTCNGTIKGTVRILKGKFDLDHKNYCTDLVHLSLENHHLKLFHLQKEQNDCEEDFSTPFEVYDLCGAKIHIVPRGLHKKKVFNKKYPICIAFPENLKTADNKNWDKGKCDYISLVCFSDGLVEVPKQKAIYFFTVTDRAKESWFSALTQATYSIDDISSSQDTSLCDQSFKKDFYNMSYSALLEANDEETLFVSEDSSGRITDIHMSSTSEKSSLQFKSYMQFLLDNFEKTVVSNTEYSHSENLLISENKDETFKRIFPLEWINVIIGRLSYDLLTKKYWSDFVISEVQRKLDKIEMPIFIESLIVTDVHMGSIMPQIHSISNPVNDDLGLWFDFDLTYKGSFHLTLQTNLKMPKGKHMNGNEESDNGYIKQTADGTDSSDEESSSSKSQSPSPSHNRLINKIEKWISHKHFQTVAQSRFVKKYVGDLSNVVLTLTVEVNSLEGNLAVNVPPAPSDRIWYGFRKDPLLSLAVYPKVGTHQINVSAIVQLIKKKLLEAFKKAIVLPNMDDLVIPIMFAPVETYEDSL